MLIGLTVDGGGKIRALQRADNIANEAARAAGQAINAGLAISGGAKVIDPAAARSAAQHYINALDGVTGSVTTIDGTHLRVTVTVRWDAVLLPLFAAPAPAQHGARQPPPSSRSNTIKEHYVARTASTTSRGGQAATGLSAAAVVALIGAMPFLLIWAAGNPLTPTLSWIRKFSADPSAALNAVWQTLSSRDDGTLFLHLLTAVAWVAAVMAAWAWISFLGAFVVELVTQTRAHRQGRTPRTATAIPGMRLQQRAAAVLVAAIIGAIAAPTLASALGLHAGDIRATRRGRSRPPHHRSRSTRRSRPAPHPRRNTPDMSRSRWNAGRACSTSPSRTASPRSNSPRPTTASPSPTGMPCKPAACASTPDGHCVSPPPRGP